GIMVGGRDEDFRAARPVLEALGAVVVRCGDVGAGQIAKACNQLIVVAALGAVAEALTVAERSGIDPARAREVLLAGYAASPILRNLGQRMLDGDFEARGKSRFNLKDIATLRALSEEHNLPLPVFDAAGAYIEQLVASGGADLDHSAVINVVRAAQIRSDS
ncbi:MAG: NAD(P)-dependent oxidoreductase, partial [Arachnia sp.]